MGTLKQLLSASLFTYLSTHTESLAIHFDAQRKNDFKLSLEGLILLFP